MGQIDSISALPQVMAWGPMGDEPLPKSRNTQFTDIYMYYQTSMS